jgi:hypothetical protein
MNEYDRMCSDDSEEPPFLDQIGLLVNPSQFITGVISVITPDGGFSPSLIGIHGKVVEIDDDTIQSTGECVQISIMLEPEIYASMVKILTEHAQQHGIPLDQ